MTEPQGLFFNQISHRYGSRIIVQDLTLTVEPGELVCILGPSGCGKTTTLRLAAGLESPHQGSVHLHGRVVSGPGVHIPPEQRNVGFLFQDFALFPHLPVGENVAFGLPKQMGADRQARVRTMLRQVGMDKYETAWPHQLSGGQQQRVALARALAPQPGLMLLDEPFSGLDKRLRDQIRDETLHVLKSNGVSALMVTHDPDEAMFMADRIAIMRDGNLVQMGRPDDLYHRPRDGFVASFFGEINRLEAPVQDGQAVCAVGSFAAPAGMVGGCAEILIRPESVTLCRDKVGNALVLTCRSLGRCQLVHVRVEHPDHPPCHMHVRLPPGDLWCEGDRARLLYDAQQAHIFAVSG